MRGFSISFERYTEESVENGDAEERGMLAEDLSFREAVAELLDLDAWDVIEGDGRHFTAYQGSDAPLYYTDEDDAGEARTLHVPDAVTASSRVRIARVLCSR